MKKILLFVILMLLPQIALHLYADGEPVELKVPLYNEQQGKLTRSNSLDAISCIYYGVISCVQTKLIEDVGIVNISVTNLSTGEVWYDSFDSGAVQQILTPISSSPGFYEVVYTTASGDVYEGTFEL